ncbi:heme NO binding protein [Roseovarius sp. A-2]|uniref:heme NO-binding domain-containing protein n=1 Tax=Roseovarius sp. A-2 TaxID=1570360 RepID=UPI0009B59644|nr:heme NO-binding domain-containing protein [Roseovarius sp. A-2]GAW36599.1 heme NO binding protein [Roseovarius sp. A-2]
MHGLVNRALERFTRDSYGDGLWLEVMSGLDLGYSEFEPLMRYEPEVTQRVLMALGSRLRRSRDDLLEDVGTYLVSHPKVEPIRRLLRFSGVDFADFLHSLEELPDRARLAVADLDLPPICLHAQGAGLYRLEVGLHDCKDLRFGPVVMGVLRAMADDYGALVVLEHRGATGTEELIEVRLLDEGFASGRAFDLGAGRQAG